MLGVMAVVWVNLSEILVDDLHPSVRNAMLDISDSLNDYYAEHSQFPNSLGDIPIQEISVKDPYSPRGGRFNYRSDDRSFLLLSLAPDRDRDLPENLSLLSDLKPINRDFQFDPTNGIKSNGDLIEYRFREK